MGAWRWGGLGRFVMLAGGLLGACSGKTRQLEDGTREGAAGAGGTAGAGAAVSQAGSVAPAGEATSGEGKLELPAPPDDSCERFRITAAACESECPPWPCAAVTRASARDWWCGTTSAGRCITGFDCRAAEAAAAGNDLINCLAEHLPCSTDADCAGETPFCVVDAHYQHGDCRGGRAGDTCRDDDDCLSGNQCIATREDGTRACTDGNEGSPCNLDAECDSQRCFHASRSLSVGMCSSGAPGAPCLADNGLCRGDARCIHVESTKTAERLFCSSGNTGEPCYADADCKSQHCPTGEDSVCTEGAAGDPCIDPADCADGFCGPGAPCEQGSTCTTGEAGQPCRTAMDCKSQRCEPVIPDNGCRSAVCGA